MSKKIPDEGEFTPSKYAHTYFEPELTAAYVASVTVLNQTLAATIQETVVDSVMKCMVYMYGTHFNHHKFFTFTGTCNYCGVDGHKEFQWTNNQKYGSNGGGGTSGVGSGGCYISTVHNKKRRWKGLWDTPTNNTDSETK